MVVRHTLADVIKEHRDVDIETGRRCCAGADGGSRLFERT
jgi:hypothetical protein